MSVKFICKLNFILNFILTLNAEITPGAVVLKSRYKDLLVIEMMTGIMFGLMFKC